MAKKYFSSDSASYYTVHKRGKKIPMHARDYWQEPQRRELHKEKGFESSACKAHGCDVKSNLEKCDYCHELFCQSHIKPKPPTTPLYDETDWKADLLREEWRNPYGHPCPPYREYWDEKIDGAHAKEFAALDKFLGHKQEEKQVKSESTIRTNPFERIDRIKSILKSEKNESIKVASINKSRFDKNLIFAAVLAAIIILYFAFFVLPSNDLQLQKTKGIMYGIASEKPLTVEARIDYELSSPIKEAYLQNQAGTKVASLTCVKPGPCVEKINLKLFNNFKVVQESDSNYSYSIQKQTYFLCIRSERIPAPKCVPIELGPAKFKSTDVNALFDSDFLSCIQGYKPKDSHCIKIQKCSDGTEFGECSLTKPNYCDNNVLIQKASICGCSSSDEEVYGETCYSKIQKIEKLVFEKTNELRQQPLKWNDDLAKLARMHSEDMAARNFFDHTNPEGDGPTERAIKLGINVNVPLGGGVTAVGIGENISQTPVGDVIGCGFVSSSESIADCAMQGWKTSPGHYSNMVNLDYTEIGVGVGKSGGTYYLTQDFR